MDSYTVVISKLVENKCLECSMGQLETYLILKYAPKMVEYFRRLRCPFCNKRFTKSSFLAAHLKSNVSKCRSTMYRIYSLAHMICSVVRMNIKRTRTRYVCTLCGFRAPFIYNMVNHFIDNHSNLFHDVLNEFLSITMHFRDEEPKRSVITIIETPLSP